MELDSSTAATESNVSVQQVRSLLDTWDRGVILADRNGQVLTLNDLARKCLAQFGFDGRVPVNILQEILQVNASDIVQRMQGGEATITLNGFYASKAYQAKLRRIRDSDWLAIELEATEGNLAAPALAAQPTVQELLQEREITYRNLLAAYLKLQEVNRQKTVFLASAAHELKTPLAVIKGYYDLLLTGSLGKLTEKQRDILEESKESCERLVRLVSMFLNYSALESGKLVLQLRENDLRDCLEEVATRWSADYQRKGVKLENQLDPSIPTFKFDYQKVQQVTSNLLDNALKHTPFGGKVILRARPHFWERRVATMAPAEERRRFRLPRPNSVEVTVADSGAGIPAEHHQEIFEDFMRVDKNTSGMGLGLAIAKRLIQAHRGKIWVESEAQRGSTFAFLLPMDQS
ncbi:MAG TPA: HAMP domain-containing sensor histidine kinase [Candidatus Sulfotelmatobacter sp.]|nr:HAMP domain-containing sensor histidine kinase [Candidatus Sulfotelmatobacter sp.]